MSASASLTPGSVIDGRYRIERPLGRGGMAVLVVAEQLGLARKVALKVLAPELVASPEAVERFLREARAVAGLHSAHLARVLDVGTLPTGEPFMALELLEGADLEAHARSGDLSVSDVVEYVTQACEGLAEAHYAGIVHRDLKPSNLFLSRAPDGSALVKVLDFGIAKTAETRATGSQLTLAHATMGSPAYMSPEQLRDARYVDARADIWALGVVLYELFSGCPPFTATTSHGLAIAIATDPCPPPPRPGLDPRVAAVVMRCLSKSADDRFDDVAELAAALAPFGPDSARVRAARIALIAGKAPVSIRPQSVRPRARVLRFGLVNSTTIDRQTFVDGLQETLGKRCEVVVAPSYQALVESLRDEEVELAWLPPVAFLRARAVKAAQLVMVMERGGAATFGCAILARNGFATSLSEVKSARVAWTDPWSSSGYVVPRAMMRQEGIDPESAFTLELFVGTTRVVIEQLRGGSVDVGSAHCTLRPDGTLARGPWGDDDGVTVLAVGGPIPCDAICAGPSLSADAKTALRTSLTHPTPELLRSVEASGMRVPDTRLYELFRMAFLA